MSNNVNCKLYVIGMVQISAVNCLLSASWVFWTATEFDFNY